MKKKRGMWVGIVIIVIVISFIYSRYEERKIYGNDIESINKVIKSLDMYAGKNIEILEVKDIRNCRIVAFLSNNNPSYAKFTKNEEGNYEWQYAEESKNQSFVMYLITIFDEENSFIQPMIVTTENNNIAKMVLDVNGKKLINMFDVFKDRVTWFELPDPTENSYKFSSKYYDSNGNLLD